LGCVMLHYLRWGSRQAAPRGILVFRHGVASHAAWVAETASGITAAGSRSTHRPSGMGSSSGRRGHRASYAWALDDVERVVSLVASHRHRMPLSLAASGWPPNSAWCMPHCDQGRSGLLLATRSRAPSFERPDRADDLGGLVLVRESSTGIVMGEGLTDRDSCSGSSGVRLHRRQRAHSQVPRSYRGPVPGGSGRRPRAATRLPRRLVLVTVRCPCHVAVGLAQPTPVVRYAEGCFGRHLLREDPASRRFSSNTGVVCRGVRGDLDWVSGWINQRPSSGR